MFKKIYIILPILLIWFLSFCEIKAWNCELEGNAEIWVCEDLSNWYTEPYCSDGIDVGATQCIWTIHSSILLPDKENWSAKRVIEKYCKAMLSTGQESWRVYFAKASPYDTGTWDWEQTFDSRQSIFVYALCSSFKDEENSTFVKEKSDFAKIFKWEWNISKTLKLQQRDQNGKDKCSLEKQNQLNECDMSIYATEIYSAIMSDIFKIKYAQVFSVDSAEKFSNTDKRMGEFFSGYFFMTDGYKKIKDQYPQTVEVVNSNQKYYKKVLDTLWILNDRELVDIDYNICATWWNKVTWLNFIKCAMHGSQWRWLTLDPPFITLIYNEILSYQLFEKTYQSWLSTKVSWNSSEKERLKYESRIRDFQSYVNKQIDATYKTLHDLEELNMTYPLHIWLLMYQEKIKKFRDKKLSPVVTLFYSLSEKLQNVQLPD